jgi:hypothetical protein
MKLTDYMKAAAWLLHLAWRYYAYKAIKRVHAITGRIEYENHICGDNDVG